MIRKKVQVAFVFICFSLPLLINSQSLTNMNQVSLKSPQVSSIEKYGLVPTNLSTGQISPSITIYNLETPELSIPIELKYSNSGLRIGENASWVGLGWNLFAGGVISQNVKGIPDDGPGGMLFSNGQLAAYQNNQMNSFQKDNYLYDIQMGNVDSERDLFTFNFLNRSGSFFFDANGAINQFDRSDLKITHTIVNNAITSFTIVDEKGIIYLFSIRELSSTSDGDIQSNQPITLYGYSWYLSSISSATGQVINFSYDDDGSYNDIYTSFTLSFGASANSNGCTVNYSLNNLTGNQAFLTATQKKLREITWASGKIKFNTQAIREDLYNVGLNQKSNALTEILVQDNANNTVRKATFTYQHFLDGQNLQKNRLKLQSVIICGRDCQSSENYEFTYFNETSQFPPLQNLSKDFDHWGYYNGAGNWTTVPTFNGATLHPSVGFYNGANKNSNSIYSRYGMLKTMKYPTGGISEFEYEGNKVNLSGYTSFPVFINTSNISNYEVGGNRVKSITNTDPITGLQTKQYFEYSVETALKYIPNYLSNKDFLHMWNGNPLTITSCGNVFFISDRPQNSMPGFHIEYSSATEKNDLNNANGFTTTTFTKSDDIGSYSQPFPTIINTGWRSGNPLVTETFKNTGTGFERIKKSSNTHLTSYQVPMSLATTSLKVQKNATGDAPDFGYQYYETAIYSYFTEQNILSHNEQIEYQGNAAITNAVDNYFESPNHFQKTRDVSTNSKNESIENKYVWAADLDNSVAPAISILKAKNINPLVRTDRFKNSLLLNSNLVIHDSYGLPTSTHRTSLTSPLSGTSSTPTSWFLTGATYQNQDLFTYSNFRLSNVNTSGFNKSYVWDHNDTRPIAEVSNAAVSDVAYTSFEMDGTGNWSISSSSRVTTDYLTGKRSYNLSNGSISKTGLNSSTTYLVSYWTKNTSPISIIGTIPGFPVQGRVYNGWRYFEHKVTGQTAIYVAGSGYLDELRLYPADAMMRTTTYDELLGVSSTTDINNVITYYEYDGLNRLNLIRDMNGKILKKICYNFSGQAETCFTACTNINPNWQNTSTPPVCQQGSCGNTGYQEQEQRDLNSCSPTYNQTRWVVGAYNPTACAQSGVTITYQNYLNYTGFTATYTNTVTGLVYSFSVPTGSGNLGCIPAGTYTLTVTKSGNLAIITFGTGCRYTTGTSATFSKLNVTSSSCNVLTLEGAY